jgi:hypothetical protein
VQPPPPRVQINVITDEALQLTLERLQDKAHLTKFKREEIDKIVNKKKKKKLRIIHNVEEEFHTNQEMA